MQPASNDVGGFDFDFGAAPIGNNSNQPQPTNDVQFEMKQPEAVDLDFNSKPLAAAEINFEPKQPAATSIDFDMNQPAASGTAPVQK